MGSSKEQLLEFLIDRIERMGVFTTNKNFDSDFKIRAMKYMFEDTDKRVKSVMDCEEPED